VNRLRCILVLRISFVHPHGYFGIRCPPISVWP
jgi:hypothetical protein